MIRISCAQLAPVVGDLAHNVNMSTEAIAAAVTDGADFVVLPELVTSGYVFVSAAEARSAAVPASDPLFDQWRRAAGNAVVVGGFCELAPDGRLFNSAAVVDASCRRVVYRKIHLWHSERDVFTAGDEPPPVLQTRLAAVGVLICYDLEFPETVRALALAGAEIVAVPTNWPLVPRPQGERPPEVVAAMAAARASRVVIACCDRHGLERGQRWTEASCVIDAAGWVVAEASNDGTAVADVDLAHSRNKNISPVNDVLTDRRPELYGPLGAAPQSADHQRRNS